MAACVLIVDDEPDIRELVSLTISRMGLDCHTAANLDEAGNLLEHYQFDACLTDMRLPDGNGVDFVREVKLKHPQLPIAVITAHGNMEAAVEAMKNGAYDFVSKPVDIEKLRKLVTTAVASSRKSAANDAEIKSPEPLTDKDEYIPPASKKTIEKKKTSSDSIAGTLAGTEAIIGDSASITELKQMVLKLANSQAPVWISGESGTGKELTARLIHQNSARSGNAFVPINCGAIPSELMESELFGHKKGSFTGAIADHDGLFLQADGGTLFLDEVAELPLAMQVKLLRTIQEKTIRPVGSAKEISIDVRILSASHKDLATEVEADRFRHDLFYRLNVISLLCPSLRQRPEDIPALAKHILEKLSGPNGEHQFTDAAVDALSSYAFPGNVRELENIIERTLAITDSQVIDTDNLQLEPRTSEQVTRVTTNNKSINGNASSEDSKPGNSPDNILAALESNRWNRKAAAKELGLTYRQLRYRISQLGIDKKS